MLIRSSPAVISPVKYLRTKARYRFDRRVDEVRSIFHSLTLDILRTVGGVGDKEAKQDPSLNLVNVQGTHLR